MLGWLIVLVLVGWCNCWDWFWCVVWIGWFWFVLFWVWLIFCNCLSYVFFWLLDFLGCLWCICNCYFFIVFRFGCFVKVVFCLDRSGLFLVWRYRSFCYWLCLYWGLRWWRFCLNDRYLLVLVCLVWNFCGNIRG